MTLKGNTMQPQITLDEAKGVVTTKTAPKVTEESIKAKIASVDFFRPDDTYLVICAITMKNGFTFVGKAAPASPENFDYAVGTRYSYEDAFKQIWSHEGYLLREQLSN